MRAGVIAAGWGRRLGGGPKALTRIGDRALIDFVLEGLVDAGAGQVTCIVNEQSTAICDHVRGAWPRLDVEWIVRTTPTSMHSFLLVLDQLAATAPGEAGYLMTTVDSVCRPGTAREFARRAAALGGTLALGVTDLVEDEKPLHVLPAPPDGMQAVSSRGVLSPVPGAADLPFRVSALSSEVGASRFVTAGFYWAAPDVRRWRDEALASGFTALRQFLGLVVSRTGGCWAVPLPPVVDVDRPEDVAAALRLVG